MQKHVNLVDLFKSCLSFLNLLFETDSYSNEYLLANFGFDTAENEPCSVCPLSAYRSPRYKEKRSMILPFKSSQILTPRGNYRVGQIIFENLPILTVWGW